jgi:hypothetical protein
MGRLFLFNILFIGSFFIFIFFGSILFFWFISVTENVKGIFFATLSLHSKGKRPAIHFFILIEKAGWIYGGEY